MAANHMTMHDLTRTPRPLLRRARLTFFIVSMIVPIVITAVAVVVLLTWLPALPERVAIHWGMRGADGFGPPSTYLWLIFGIGLGFPVLIATVTLLSVGVHWGGVARLMGALAAGLAAFIAVTSIGALAIQRDLAETADSPGIGAILTPALVGFVVVGGVGWAVQPRVQQERGGTLEPRYAVNVAKGERVVWVATTTMTRAALAVLFLMQLGLVALAAYLIGTGIEGGWIVAVVVLLVGFSLAAIASFRVKVTPEGFFARALLGWPRIRIPIEEAESARAVDVSPFGEFGGWGWRIAADGRTGIILRRGAAIEICRRDRRPFIVTIDGAEEAAALLQAYLDRSLTPRMTSTDRKEATS